MHNKVPVSVCENTYITEEHHYHLFGEILSRLDVSCLPYYNEIAAPDQMYTRSVITMCLSVYLSVCHNGCIYCRQHVHHVRSLCLNSSRANRIRQSYKLAGQLRRSRSQCTSKLLLRMHSVANSTDDTATPSSNSSNNSSTGCRTRSIH